MSSDEDLRRALTSRAHRAEGRGVDALLADLRPELHDAPTATRSRLWPAMAAAALVAVVVGAWSVFGTGDAPQQTVAASGNPVDEAFVATTEDGDEQSDDPPADDALVAVPPLPTLELETPAAMCAVDEFGQPLADAPMPGDWMNECGFAEPDQESERLGPQFPGVVQSPLVEEALARWWDEEDRPGEFVGLCRLGDERYVLFSCAARAGFPPQASDDVLSYEFISPSSYGPNVLDEDGLFSIPRDAAAGVLVTRDDDGWRVFDEWSVGVVTTEPLSDDDLAEIAALIDQWWTDAGPAGVYVGLCDVADERAGVFCGAQLFVPYARGDGAVSFVNLEPAAFTEASTTPDGLYMSQPEDGLGLDGFTLVQDNGAWMIEAFWIS